jgi:NAD+ kinase
MIVTKIFDDEPIKHTLDLIKFLVTFRPDATLFVQYEFQEFPVFQELLKKNPHFVNHIDYWYTDKSFYPPEFFDLILSLGGDGTILFASYLFQRICPPILSFSLGSLSFLTEFEIHEYKSIFNNVFDNGYQCSIRLRFECAIMRNKDRTSPDSSTINFPTQKHEFSFTVLNEVVIDRGPNSQMTSLEIFNDDEKLTTVEADGLIISTPTGSTAYSLSAGGSLVHPEIPGILISPICPHTLSFRPLIVPEQMILRISVPYNSRSTAWCSFDGKNRVELGKGDFLSITTSKYPIMLVKNGEKNVRNSWFERLSETLHWNERKPQKPLKDSS